VHASTKLIGRCSSYAPTNVAEEEEKEKFDNSLQNTIDHCNKKINHIIIVMGDFNAKVGRANSNREQAMGENGSGSYYENGGEAMGENGSGTYYENGERLCEFALTNE
jgi:exonuclease III